MIAIRDDDEKSDESVPIQMVADHYMTIAELNEWGEMMVKKHGIPWTPIEDE